MCTYICIYILWYIYNYILYVYIYIYTHMICMICTYVSHEIPRNLQLCPDNLVFIHVYYIDYLQKEWAFECRYISTDLGSDIPVISHCRYHIQHFPVISLVVYPRISIAIDLQHKGILVSNPICRNNILSLGGWIVDDISTLNPPLNLLNFPLLCYPKWGQHLIPMNIPMNIKMNMIRGH